jgi:hypothetical protein
MRNQILIFFLCINLIDLVGAQTIQWQKTLGGTEADVALSIKQEIDTHFIIAGRVLSANGNVTGNKGVTDFWIVKLNPSGNMIWQKALGGSNNDRCYSVDLTNDGGYILTGSTASNNGNVSGNHGDLDCWVVKLDENANIQWQKCLGGTGWDEAWSIQQTTDGGYIVIGRTGSNNGDVTGLHSSLDVWVVKLSSFGDVEWQKALGGSLLDIGYSIQQTQDGGYILVGESNSIDGDCSGLHGSSDFWVVKLSSEGVLEWQKMLGSSSLDRPNSIINTNDGGYAVFGQISWNDGDVSEHFGGFDFWIAKLDAFGEIQWEATYGGSSEEFGTSITQTEDNGFVLTGGTQSTDGQVIGNDGGADLWIVKIDPLGNLIWQKTLGGTQDEMAHSVIQSIDGGLAIAGYARSNNGDVSGNHGSTDFWVVKLAPVTSTTTAPTAIPLNLYPNPAQNWFRLNLPITESGMQISITDAQGRVVLVKTIRSDERMDVFGLATGVYTVSVVSMSGQMYTGKLVKD